MAHKKAGSSTRNGRDSESKDSALEKFGGKSGSGNIIVRQRGASFIRKNVGCGRDRVVCQS